ncbi:hypothetical protein [Candidatus Halobonum tyrrellensis]|uniref:Uncharacterized protein n=1 Tax=Candidatus Halobonum tyrrellensis G22 TaxID=1324957 RepID=V4HD05_9EURY|nr:hypothetical protein [Candidatus Halobonum tyrrellensis]ESP88605.1 hypothetical protein K933_09097 [Candidatus Halobonum tyrrellensis G22]
MRDMDVFFQMACEFPVRTTIFTFGLPAFGLLQLLNGFVHEGSLVYIGMFSVLAVALSVVLTRYHVAVYRRSRVAEW